MEFIEPLFVGRQACGEHCGDLIVGGFGADPPVPMQEPPGVGIHDEHRPTRSIEHNTVGGFRADAIDS